MSNTPRKLLLIAGLGRNADPTKFQVDQVEQVLAAAEKDLSEAGFDSEHITLDPQDVANSISKLEDKIASRDWDLFEIGFAVRGIVESTEVFEKAVNVWIREMPGKALIFPQGPHDIVRAPLRMFAGAK